MRDLEASGVWFIGYGIRGWTILSPVDLDSLLGLFYVITDRKFMGICQPGPVRRIFQAPSIDEGSGLIKLMHILKTNINFKCS